MRSRAVCALSTVVVAFAAGCGGSGDDRPDLAPATPTSERPKTATATLPAEAPSAAQAPAPIAATSIAARSRRTLEQRMTEAEAAIGRWDEEFGVCVGPSGDGDDSGATCTHAAWERLVTQMDIALYYLLPRLRAMPRGRCHEALSAEGDALRAFWNGGAPLNLAWLDEQQRPPSRFDLETAVDLVRPVPARIREALSTVCAP